MFLEDARVSGEPLLEVLGLILGKRENTKRLKFEQPIFKMFLF